LGKFIKEQIEKAKAVKNSLKVKAMFKGKQGLYTFFSIWFSTMKAYASGNPSWVMRQAWKVYVVPFVPGDWVCTDEGYEGVKARRRCQLIQHRLNKTDSINSKDKKWVFDELIPAFQKDFESKNLDIDKLGDMDESSIESKLKQVKGQKKFKEMLK